MRPPLRHRRALLFLTLLALPATAHAQHRVVAGRVCGARAPDAPLLAPSTPSTIEWALPALRRPLVVDPRCPALPPMRGENPSRPVVDPLMPLLLARRRLGITPPDAIARPWLLLQIANAAWTELVPPLDGPVCRTHAHLTLYRPCVGAMRESIGASWDGEPIDDFTRERCALMRVSFETILRDHASHELAGTALAQLVDLWIEAGFPSHAERALTAHGDRASPYALLWPQWLAVADAYASAARHEDERRCLDRASRLADTPAALAQVAYRFGLRHLAAQNHPAALRAFESAADNLRQASGEAPGDLMHDIAVGLGFALARLHPATGTWSPRAAWEHLERIVSWDAGAAFEAMLVEFVRARQLRSALAGYEYRGRERGGAMTPQHAWVIAMLSPRAEAVERLSKWVRTLRYDSGIAALAVLEIAARWHRESLDRGPRDAEGLRDAMQLYQAIMEAARSHLADDRPQGWAVDAGFYHADARCALYANQTP